MPRTATLLLVLAVTAAACSDRFVSVEVADLDVSPVEPFEQTLVYAADGSVIATFRFDYRDPVAYHDVPQVLVDAVVAAEDHRFFSHDGIDPWAIARAALANRRAGAIVQGGSTITQQLVKQRYFPDAPQTLERKAMEAHLARQLEREASKGQILTDYLNTVYFGSGAYGIEAAAATYFRTTTSALTLSQAALLAGLIRAPERTTPHRHPAEALAERRRVLDRMVATGAITSAERDAADAAPLEVAPPPEPPPTRYPHFVEHVKRTLISDSRFGYSEEARWRRLFGGGLRIHTTLEPPLQAAAEAAATRFWSGPDDPEVALAVVRPDSGEIVATVGGRDFAASQFDLAAQGRRQPGSTFKVFALAAALNSGWRLDDTIASGSAAFDVGDDEPWVVGSGTGGQITLRDALIRSSNGAFARLALELGPERIAQTAQTMGITSDVGHNPSIVLGGLRTGVSPLEMAGAFSTLANGGIHVPPTPISHITDAAGEVVWEPRRSSRTALDRETAWLITDTLTRVVSEGTGQLADIGRPVAGKTGTVQEYRDAWFVGFTPELATAVWIGYPDEQRPLLDVHGVSRVEGGTWPARIFAAFMREALAGVPPSEFTYPAELTVTVRIDPLTGGLATPWCPTTEELVGLPGEVPAFSCPLHAAPPPPLLASTPPPTTVTTAPPAPAAPTSTPVAPPAPTAAAAPTPTPTPTPTATATATPTPTTINGEPPPPPAPVVEPGG